MMKDILEAKKRIELRMMDPKAGKISQKSPIKKSGSLHKFKSLCVDVLDSVEPESEDCPINIEVKNNLNYTS